MALSIERLEKIKAEFIRLFVPYDNKLRQWEQKRETAFKSHNALTQFLQLPPIAPEYYPGYHAAVDMMEQIEVHASKNKFPAKLFISRAPNETDQEYAYRKANYKNTTHPVFTDYINTISRSLSDQNWSFSADEDLSEYIYNLPTHISLEQYFKDFIPGLKTIDANGIIAIEPSEVKYRRDSEGAILLDEQGAAMISDEQIDPVPVYYSCARIVAQNIGEWYAVISHKKSVVEYGGKPEKSGIIIQIFDNENIYEFRQIGKRIDYTFSPISIIYRHGLGRVNAEKLKGVPALYEDKVIYFSPFSSAADLLDLCLLDESNLTAVKATTIYNYKVAIGTPCTFQRDGHSCNDGKLFDPLYNGGVGGEIKCPGCDGNGLRPRMSPFGILLINPGSTISEGDRGISGDYLKLIGPPVEAPKLLREEIEKNERRARKMIHLPDADSAVVGDEGKTATGSLNKARATYAFIKPISDQMFDLYEFMISAINSMRFSTPLNFTLIKPQSFDIQTPTDYLAIIGELNSLGLPPSLVSAHIDQYLSSLMYTSPEKEAIFKLLFKEDLLLAMSREDINLRLTAEKIEPWRDTLHQSGLQLIEGLIREDEQFLFREYSDQRDALIQAAKDATITGGESAVVRDAAMRLVTDVGA